MIPALLVACVPSNAVSLASEPTIPPLERYTQWLAAKDPAAVAQAQERPESQLGPFHFYSVPTSRGKRLEAAVSDLTLVARDGTGDWATFLQAGPPEEVARRVAWLEGMKSLLLPGTPAVVSLARSSPEIAALITAPAVRVTDANVVFDAWYVAQPGNHVAHLTIAGRPDGGTWTWTPR